MARDKCTLMVLTDGPSRIRHLTVSRWTVRGVSVGLAFVLLVLTALAITVSARESHRLRARRLEREKVALTEALDRMRARVDHVEAQLADLSEKGERYRLMAGLASIDEDVLQAGIGGPGTELRDAASSGALDAESRAKLFTISYDLNALARRARLLSESLDEAADSLEAHRDLLESTPSIFPASGLLTSPFSRARRHPILHETLPHEGIDISASEGTPILAAAKGRVTYVGWRPGYGLMVELDHGYGYATRYAHASRTLVRRGERVERGTPIAKVGRTGLATGWNLHYEVLVGGKPVDPLRYVITGAIPY